MKSTDIVPFQVNACRVSPKMAPTKDRVALGERKVD